MGIQNRLTSAFTGALLLVITISAPSAGVLVSGDMLSNARNNAVNPVFADAMRDSTVLGDAVRYLVSGNDDDGQVARIGTLRAALDANGYLSDARGLSSDLSSLNLYRALVAYDIISSGTGLFTPEDREGLKRTCMTVLDHYLDPSFFDWDDSGRALGVSAMRVVASCALFAGSFEHDTAADRYRQHALRYLTMNIRDGIDDYGAWTAGNPGDAGEVIEYMTIAAKSLRALGFEDMFTNPRFVKLITSGITRMPPRQSPYTRDYRNLAIGQTLSHEDSSREAMLTAADIYDQYPNEASELVWYWHECGSPSGPLGVIFIDTSIPYMRPDLESAVVGGGTAVFRDLYASSSESMVAAVFGDVRGASDYERVDHHDAGDISFIWDGYPVIFHDGYVADKLSELLLNRQSWRHSTVLPLGLGDSPVIPDLSAASGTAQSAMITEPSDFYPDGINQFMSTPLLDYVSGQAAGGDYDTSILSHSRNMLFMKPNALVVYDEVAAPGPVEWDMWMPVRSSSTNANILSLVTRNGVELQTVFAGQTTVNYSVDDAPENITHDWPILMRAPFGQGTIIVCSIDATRAAASSYAAIFTQLLTNIAAPEGSETVGLLDGSGTFIQMLSQEGITVVPFSVGIPGLDELTRFGSILINTNDPTHDYRMLVTASETLKEYVRQGGRLVWVGAERTGIDSGTPDNPGLIPIAIAAGTIPIQSSFDITDGGISLAPDQVWTSPNQISADSFRLLVEDLCASGLFSGTDNSPAVTAPPAWSSAWQSIATVRRTFPVQASPTNVAGELSRVRVTRQNPANGILALLLPSKQGEPYKYTVTTHRENYIAFSDPVNAWEVTTGPASWNDARLSAKHTAARGRLTYWAFDCTYLTLGAETISALYPFTIYYDAIEDRGIIQTSVNNEFTFSGGMVKLHAGEISFTNLSVNIITRRSTYLTRIRVVDGHGVPIPNARITRDGSFTGETDNGGFLSIRWADYQPAVSIRHGSLQSSGLLVPGEMTFVLDSSRL